MDTSIVRFDDNGREISFTADDVRRYVNPQAPEKDVALFMAFCQSHQLDPIGMKDAYLVGYNGRNGYQSSIITSYHVFNKLACSHDTYDGIESGIIVQDPQGNIVELPGAALFAGYILLGGWARVYDRARTHPFYARVGLADYNTGRSQWKERPAMMIEKVAKCQAWRGMYPEMRGMYSSEEMGQQPQPQPVQEYRPEPSGATETAAEVVYECEPVGNDTEALRAAIKADAEAFATAKGRTIEEVYAALLKTEAFAGSGFESIDDLAGETLAKAAQIVRAWAGTVR